MPSASSGSAAAAGASPATKPQLTLQTVERAMSVLEMVAASAVLPSPRMIAEGLGLNITTTYHLVNTLCARGYLARDPDGRVRIGTQVAALHNALIRQGGLARDLQHFVEELATATGETCYLARLTDDGVVLAAADQSVRDRLLAPKLNAMKPAARKKYLAQLQTQLREYEERGWSYDFEGVEPGVFVVAAAYFDSSGQVAGSVATAVPQPRWEPRRGLFVGSVVATAKAISWHLGHQPSGTNAAPPTLSAIRDAATKSTRRGKPRRQARSV